MEKRFAKAMKAVPADKQAEVKEMAGGLDDIFDNINVGEFTKSLIQAGIDWAQKSLLPAITAKNAMAGALFAALLDAMENAVK